MKFCSGIFFLLFLPACASVKKIDPKKKIAPAQLEADYTLFQNILQDQHPGLYWYTSKDSMDFFFRQGT